MGRYGGISPVFWPGLAFRRLVHSFIVRGVRPGDRQRWIRGQDPFSLFKFQDDLIYRQAVAQAGYYPGNDPVLR